MLSLSSASFADSNEPMSGAKDGAGTVTASADEFTSGNGRETASLSPAAMTNAAGVCVMPHAPVKAAGVTVIASPATTGFSSPSASVLNMNALIRRRWLVSGSVTSSWVSASTRATLSFAVVVSLSVMVMVVSGSSGSS